MSDAKGKGQRKTREIGEPPGDPGERRSRRLGALLASITPEDTLSRLKTNALQAVRALGEELRRRVEEEAEECAARGVPTFYGWDSTQDRDQVLGELLDVFGLKGAAGLSGVLFSTVERVVRADAVVRDFIQVRGAGDPLAWPLEAPAHLAEVLREIPDALWAPHVLLCLDRLGPWLRTRSSSQEPVIALLPKEDGSLVVLNVGRRAARWGEWLGFTKGSNDTHQGKILAPAWDERAFDDDVRLLEEALSGLVRSKETARESKEWRDAENRARFLISFSDPTNGKWNYAAFSKKTGISTSTRANKAAFRKVSERTFREAIREGGL